MLMAVMTSWSVFRVQRSFQVGFSGGACEWRCVQRVLQERKRWECPRVERENRRLRAAWRHAGLWGGGRGACNGGLPRATCTGVRGESKEVMLR